MIEDCVIVPVRKLAETKLRLSSILPQDKRAELTSALLRRVLDAVERSNSQAFVLVASDPDEASRYFSGYSKLNIISESVHLGGVNSAMRDGIDFAFQKNSSLKKLLLLPSDLPFINETGIDNALALLEKYDLIINPSERKNGTNLLGISSGMKRFELHYDDDSYSKHVNEAKTSNLNFISLEWKEFSYDVDDASDFEGLMRTFKAASFDDLLLKISRTV